MRKLKRLTLILIFPGLAECSNVENQSGNSYKLQKAEKVDNSIKGDTAIVEKYFPAENKVSVKDTIIQALGIQITMKERTLDTYVTNGYTDNNLKYVYKYRDIERTLKVLRHNEVLVDTLLTKETFKDILSKEFMGISNFYSYDINKVEADKIEFFGVIGKPDTDWTFTFYHYFDLSTKKFEIKSLENEEM